jgi:signal transduction histidine kinase
MTSSVKDARRARLAFMLLSPVLAMVLISVAASVVILDNLGMPAQAEADAGLARVGDDFALVIVTDASAPVTEIRELIAFWGMAVPAAVLVLASLLAWVMAGRVETRLALARQSIHEAERSSEHRLQEVLHELRTPLAVMGTNLELAGVGPVDRSARYVDAARRAVSRMARTVDDLAGHGGLAVGDGAGLVELGEVARSVAAENYGPTRSAGAGISLNGHDPVEVAADPDAVRTVVSNFMSNAMRSSPRGSTIGLDWGTEGEWAWLAVLDEGAGIPYHLHARVFERGWRGRHGRDRDQGSGLGLTIARQLAEAQGGVLTVESEEGGGAVFALWLPLGPGASRIDVVDEDSVHPRVRPWQRVAATL